MRIRPILCSALVGGSTLALLAGCSGKPENSPVIRKKFAELEETSNKVEELSADVQMLNDQVRRLIEETNELRTILPEVDGEEAVSKIQQLEDRLKTLETSTADDLLASATSTGSSTSQAQQTSSAGNTSNSQEESSGDEELENAPLAGNSQDQQESTETAQNEVPEPSSSSSSSSSFKENTNRQASSSSSNSTGQQASSSSSSASAESSTDSRKRGQYHTIESGETLSEIANKYDVEVNQLLKANRIPEGARLARGQRLYVPGN